MWKSEAEEYVRRIQHEKTWLAFEDGRWTWTKPSLETRIGKEMDSSLEPSEGTQTCRHSDFSTARLAEKKAQYLAHWTNIQAGSNLLEIRLHDLSFTPRKSAGSQQTPEENGCVLC